MRGGRLLGWLLRALINKSVAVMHKPTLRCTMPALNPRLTITLKPSTSSLLRRASELTGKSQSALIAELVEVNEPVFERLVKLLQAAYDAKSSLSDDVRKGLEDAQARVEHQLGLAIDAFDSAALPILESAEEVRRRGARSSRPRAPTPAVTPPSNRGVRSRNPEALKRAKRGH